MSEWATVSHNGISNLIPYLDFKVKMGSTVTGNYKPYITIMKSPMFFPRFTPYVWANRSKVRKFNSEFEEVTHKLLRKFANNSFIDGNDLKISLSYRYKTDADCDERYIMFKLARGL